MLYVSSTLFSYCYNVVFNHIVLNMVKNKMLSEMIKRLHSVAFLARVVSKVAAWVVYVVPSCISDQSQAHTHTHIYKFFLFHVKNEKKVGKSNSELNGTSRGFKKKKLMMVFVKISPIVTNIYVSYL